MTSELQGALIGAVAWLVFMLDERPSLAPDSLYYEQLAQGKRVPRPFCFRAGIPALVGRLCGRKLWRWEAVVFVSLCLQGMAMTRLAGGHPLAAALLLGLPGGARFAVRHPMLVDAPVLALVLLTAAGWQDSTRPWWWMALGGLVFSGLRENAGLWLAILTGQPWVLAGIPFGLAAGSLSSGRKAAPRGPLAPDGDNAWIVNPLATALAARRGAWLTPGLMLLPWGVVLPLALLSPSWYLAGVLLVAYVPLVLTSDTARVVHWAAPAVVLVALQAPVPEWAWLPLVVAHWFNPYRGA